MFIYDNIFYKNYKVKFDLRKIIGIAGWSGSGKTTVVESLINIFKTKYNFTVCALKHAHENFKIDQEGKDSYRFSEAGAKQVIISSKKQWALINNLYNKEKDLDYLLKKTENTNIVLVEGWKYSKLKKIEIYREKLGREFLYIKDKNIVAIALEDTNIPIKRSIHKLNLNDHLSIADFIVKNDFDI